MFRHALIVFFTVLGLLPRETKAEEFIKSFDAAIQVETSGSLEVTETITVHATGDKIRHGIYRDFPSSWVEGDETGFKIVTVERDGRQDGWSREAISGGTRVYLGTQSQMVPPGDHTYRISYRTDNQVRSHDTYDNLVWNVTGNDWLFPIALATARVSLPNNAKPEDATVYTGPAGSRGKDATAQISNTAASFAMKRSLSVGEGLTIDIKIPKGVISPPAPVQRPAFWWWDGRTAMAGGSVLAIALLVLFSLWFLYGKDPSKGTTPLRWTAPEGLSPGLIGYIQDNGFPDYGYTAFSASLIDLAANGYLKIKTTQDATYIIRTKKAAPDKLQCDHFTILSYISDTDAYTELSKNNQKFAKSILLSYCRAIKSTRNEQFYKKQHDLMIFGSIFMASSVLLSLSITKQNLWTPLSIIMLLPFSFFIPGLFSLLLLVIKQLFSLNDYFYSNIVRYYLYFVIISTTVTMLWLFASEGSPDTRTELSLVISFLPIASILIFLMGRATERGRAIKDQIDGLRKYLTLSTNRRVAISGLPTMSPTHFESLLPYAIVLGVEGPWLRAFEEWEDTPTNKGALSYNPKWWTSDSFGLTGRGFGGALYQVISTSAPSSSSFGSGFSGSGGGGGGGGGW